MHNLFNATARGVTYWRKHKHHICYKCRQYGHISYDCINICKLCGNLHTGTVCIFSLLKLYRKINRKLKGSLIRDPEEIRKFIKESQEKILIETGEKKLEDYYMKLASKPKKYEGLSIAQPCRLNYPRKKKTLQDINREIREEMEKKGNSKIEVVKKIQQQRRDKLDELFAQLETSKPRENIQKTDVKKVNKKKGSKKIRDEKPQPNKKITSIQDLNKLILNSTIEEIEPVKPEPKVNFTKPVISVTNDKGPVTNGKESEDSLKKSKEIAAKVQLRFREEELKIKKINLDELDAIQKQVDKAKTELTNTKRWITDFQYYCCNKKELKNMEEKWEKLNKKSKKVEEKINKQYQKLKERKEEFYKKKDEFYNFKEEVYKRMKNDNEKARERVFHKFKQARKKNHITEIAGMYKRAQQIGYRGSFKKFKDDYFRNPTYFDEKYFPEKNWR
jgi:hypothetical protein